MSTNMNKPLLFIYLLLFPALLRAQDFPVLHYTINDGLPSNKVYQVYRDSKGYLWTATDKGIARYNGIRYEIFTTFNGLPDNEIFLFQEDKEERLWMGTYNGELCYYKNDTFHTAANTPFLRLPFRTAHIRLIRSEPDSSITIIFNNRAKFLNIKHNQCRTIELKIDKEDLSSVFFYSAKLSENRYLLVFYDTSYVIDTFSHIYDTAYHYDFHQMYGFTTCQNQNYLFSRSKIYTSYLQPVRESDIDFKKHSLHTIYINDTTTFYATSSGLFINGTIHSLKGIDVSSITQDNAGNYWAATLGQGIYVIRNDFLKTKIYRNAYSSTARYACWRGQHLFFVTAGNDLYALHNGKVSPLFYYKKYKRQNYDNPSDFGFIVDDNYEYFNTYNSDYIHIDNILSKKAAVKVADISMSAKAIYKTKDMIYLKTHNGVAYMPRANPRTSDIWIKDASTGAEAIKDRIFGMAQAPDNSIWYSTINGMYKTGNEPRRVLQPQFKNITLKSFNFLGEHLIGYTHNNLLLVCSNINSNRMSIDTISPQNCIWDKFYPLDATHLLISTNNLYRLFATHSSGEKKFTADAIDNPFVPLEVETICSDSLNCYFFKDGAIISIDIKSLLEKAQPPKLFFTTLNTGKKTYPVRSEMEVPYREAKNITISFTPLSPGSKNLVYQYSVSKNGEDNWRDVAAENINFVNTGYGEYTVKVKAKTISGNYCEPIVLLLVILQPYWASWWFIMLSVCAVLALTGVIIRYRILQTLHKKEKEHLTAIKFMRSEYKALNALMNPHFIFNTLNNVQSLFNSDNKLAANAYLRVFADLIRQNMTNISMELIPLQKEIDLVNNYLLLEQMRFEDALNYSIVIDEGLELSEIFVPPLLIQPLVENSIKHGILPLKKATGIVNIYVYERDNTLYIKVKDNGVGMAYSKSKQENQKGSYGLENIRKRIEQLSIIQNKNITFNITDTKDDDGKNLWTISTISIPVSD